RAGSIKPYLEKGNAGIANDGLLVSRSSEGLNLKERANLKRLFKAENRDREALYNEIAKANKFSPDKVEDIKKLFAKSWIKKARTGWWVQEENGKWRRK
ncbi:MAG: YdbL family protein, partial [Deltaproteobacteria bacterium]|nr:YdbL family protein [Deltaproteobacteria bacterium]